MYSSFNSTSLSLTSSIRQDIFSLLGNSGKTIFVPETVEFSFSFRFFFSQSLHKIMNKMVTELSLYMNPIELDKCMDFMWTLEQGEFDTNMTVGDCEMQLKLILGSERYEMMRESWGQDNTRLMSVYGKLKYKCKKDGMVNIKSKKCPCCVQPHYGYPDDKKQTW